MLPLSVLRSGVMGLEPSLSLMGHLMLTDKGAFRNHPCTVWANSFVMNWQWLLHHGLALCEEYRVRYGKTHTCHNTLLEAKKILPTGDPTGRSGKSPEQFVFAGPDEFKLDTSIDIYDKYKMYIRIQTLGERQLPSLS